MENEEGSTEKKDHVPGGESKTEEITLNLKNRVRAFLKGKGETFKDLADDIEISEVRLDKALANNTLDIRTLEKISKTLQIPFFSFFRDPLEPEPKIKIPFYTQRLPRTEKDHVKSNAEVLEDEIELLKMHIHDKEEQLKTLAKGE